MAQDTETTLQEVIDREAIRDLPLRYCHCVWQKDVDGYVNLFTEDGAMSTTDSSLPQAKGSEGLRKMIQEALADLQPRPHIHNHVIEMAGPDRAKGTCYVEVRMTREGKPWRMSGYYDDVYVKVAGEWKFQSRETTIDSFGPLGSE